MGIIFARNSVWRIADCLVARDQRVTLVSHSSGLRDLSSVLTCLWGDQAREVAGEVASAVELLHPAVFIRCTGGPVLKRQDNPHVVLLFQVKFSVGNIRDSQRRGEVLEA